jgi:hypothetical protein
MKKLADLKVWENNPQELDADKFGALKESLKEFGYVDPLIINEQGVIIGGNHRYLAMLEVLGPEAEIQCVLTKLTPIQQKKLNIALNNLHGIFDAKMLKGIMDDIMASESPDITTLGFTQDELDSLDIKAEIDDPDIDRVLQASRTKDKKADAREFICSKCGAKNIVNIRLGKEGIEQENH